MAKTVPSGNGVALNINVVFVSDQDEAVGHLTIELAIQMWVLHSALGTERSNPAALCLPDLRLCCRLRLQLVRCALRMLGQPERAKTLLPLK